MIDSAYAKVSRYTTKNLVEDIKNNKPWKQ